MSAPTTPTHERWRTTTRLGAFADHVERHHGVTADDHDALHRWSVTDPGAFWTAVWEFSGVRSDTPPGPALADASMPGARWFPTARVNYARHVLDALPPDDVVVVTAHSQSRPDEEVTAGQLRRRVAQFREALRSLGVGLGDRVVAYLPNVPETLVAHLAAASLGAVWASCAPEFGARAVVDRFAQVEPVVLLVVDGYRFGDKDVDRRAEVAALRAGLPTVRHVLQVALGDGPGAAGTVPDALDVAELLARFPDADPREDPVGVPFDHPLVVLFSSGTTGRPKAIVHGHGGVLLEHLKNHALSWDLGPGDVLLWFSTTAWMMWNALVSGLLTGAGVVLLDGNPLHPDPGLQWRLAERTGATVLGLSPGFLMAARAAGSHPAREHDLSAVKQVCAAGSPLAPEGYAWVAQEFGPGVLLNVGSGGTDVCSGLVQGSPALPVRPGRIAGSCLGVDAAAFDADGHPVVGELGELVVRAPLPSMPVALWGDEDGSRYRATYFDVWPGTWRHGDWVRFDADGGVTVAGRSDATLNRGGVRLGTAEFYAVVEELEGVEDSLVVHLEDPAGGPGDLVLLLALSEGADLDDDLRSRVVRALRSALSPRHVPDSVHAVPVVPRNRTGKKLELPVKRILLGARPEDVAGRDVLADPTALDAVVALAAARAGGAR